MVCLSNHRPQERRALLNKPQDHKRIREENTPSGQLLLWPPGKSQLPFSRAEVTRRAPSYDSMFCVVVSVCRCSFEGDNIRRVEEDRIRRIRDFDKPWMTSLLWRDLPPSLVGLAKIVQFAIEFIVTEVLASNRVEPSIVAWPQISSLFLLVNVVVVVVAWARRGFLYVTASIGGSNVWDACKRQFVHLPHPSSTCCCCWCEPSPA